MSKFKLERDDLRKSRKYGDVYHIIQVSENAVRCLRNQYTLKPETFDKEEFWRETKYLGKSKANIDDLFKTEDNEKCIEDNTPHTESTVLFKTENEE